MRRSIVVGLLTQTEECLALIDQAITEEQELVYRLQDASVDASAAVTLLEDSQRLRSLLDRDRNRLREEISTL